MNGSGSPHAPLLVVAHPGHELRVHGWLERARPRVLVLTDGSGHTGRSRLDSTERILAGAGARPGPIFGELTDREVYEALLSHDVGRFTDLARRVAAELAGSDTGDVLCDAAQGYNPVHDVCRFVVGAAAMLAAAGRPAAPAVYDFPLVGPPVDAGFDAATADGVWLRLTDEEFAHKLAATKSYARLDADVAAALREFGEDAFRVEFLRRVEPRRPVSTLEPPYYETYGEQQVRSGHYANVLRYREHVRPVEEALRALAPRVVR